jgi:hypothetical protein
MPTRRLKPIELVVRCGGAVVVKTLVRAIAVRARAHARRLDRQPLVHAVLAADGLYSSACALVMLLGTRVANATLAWMVDAASAGLSATTPAETLLEVYILFQCAMLRARKRPVELALAALTLFRRVDGEVGEDGEDGEDGGGRRNLDAMMGLAHAFATRIDTALPGVLHEVARAIGGLAEAIACTHLH